MKPKLLLIATIVLLCGQNFLYSQETWQYLDGLNDQYLWKVYAQSPDTVYITGASSRYDGQGMIAKSTNGGINWIKTFTTTNNLLKDIAFYDKNTGFVIGEKGVILKTTNGGADWTLKTSGTTQNLNAIALTGLNNIWVVGDGGVVIHSIDEGETWQKLDLQLTTKLNDIAFKKDTGYIAGNSGLLYKTLNAGTIWNKEVISNTILNPSQDCMSLSMTENNIYILCGFDYSYGYDLLSKSISTDWLSHSCMSNSITFINDNVGYSIYEDITTGGSGTSLKIFKTTNSGELWSEVYENWTSSIDIHHSDIYIINDTVKYIVSGSAILKSTPSTPITAIKESLYDKPFVIFQNPLKSELTVKSNLQPILEIELYNSSGNKVSMKRMNSQATEIMIDISKLPIGVYLLQITLANNIQHVYKCIKN